MNTSNPLISITLVEPENADNIGAVARAMKNMGLTRLCLVKPPALWKSKGKKMAVNAEDVLVNAEVLESLKEIIQDQHLVVATTRRSGPQRGVYLPYKECIKKIKQTRKKKKIMIVFGKESKGLNNHDIGLCDWVTTIPVSPVYPSINLAQAVMIICFSLMDHDTELPPNPPKRGHKRFQEKVPVLQPSVYVDKKGVEQVLDKVEEMLHHLNYEGKSSKISRIRATLHRLFKRNGLLESEAQMFKGLTRRVIEKVRS